jgi:hypothetical protein
MSLLKKKDKFKVEHPVLIGRPRGYDLKEEAKLFIEWADQEENLIYRLFAAVRGYSSQDKLYEYADMCEEFRGALNYAKMVIGSRREIMLAKGKGNPAPFQRYASYYDAALKRHEKEIKQDENSFTGSLKVEITDFKHAS